MNKLLTSCLVAGLLLSSTGCNIVPHCENWPAELTQRELEPASVGAFYQALLFEETDFEGISFWLGSDLPEGLELDDQLVSISGTPSAAGTTSFVVYWEGPADTVGCSHPEASAEFELMVE